MESDRIEELIANGTLLNSEKERTKFFRKCYLGDASREKAGYLVAFTPIWRYFVFRDRSSTSPEGVQFVVHIRDTQDSCTRICIYELDEFYLELNTKWKTDAPPEIAAKIPDEPIKIRKLACIDQIIAIFMSFGLKPFIGEIPLRYQLFGYDQLFLQDNKDMYNEEKNKHIPCWETKYGVLYKFPDWTREFNFPEFWLFQNMKPDTVELRTATIEFLESLGIAG
jgi:hypothetical protein